MYKLFLDDIRHPQECAERMRNPIYNEKWVVVKDYDEFCSTVIAKGIPEVISYDHDLCHEHMLLGHARFMNWDEYNKDETREMTGYDCAKWMKEHCRNRGEAHPPFLVHSQNPVGANNIKSYLHGR